jgi:uncharacterized repeat protein (TIGR01451 family)
MREFTMRISGIFFILLVLCHVVQSMEYDFHIDIQGDGYLYGRSDLKPVRDYINAHGEQKYDKYYADIGGQNLFISNYNLTKPSEGSNIYSIISSFPDGMTHFVKVNSSSGIFSKNWVERRAKSTSTNYQIALVGDLYEGITSKELLRGPRLKSEARAGGIIRMASGLASNGSDISESDAERLIQSLNAVPLTSETGQIEIVLPKTNVSINGEYKFTASDPLKGKIYTLNQMIGYDFPSKIDSKAANERKQDELKEKNVSIAENYKGDIIAWGVPIEWPELDVGIMVHPSSGQNGTKARITIDVTNFGETKGFERVSVTSKLPKEMKFIKSPDGTYVNGYIYWPDIGPLGPLGEKTLSFDAQINKQLSNPSNVTITVDAEGTASDGTKDSDSGWINFTIEGPSIAIEKFADNKEIPIGKEFTYTIIIENPSTIKLDNIIVEDALPVGMEFIGSTSGFMSSNGKAIWKGIFSLMPGEKKVLTYVARIVGEFEDMEAVRNNATIVAMTEGGQMVAASDTSEIRVVKGPEAPLNNSSNIIMRIKSAPDLADSAKTEIKPGIDLALTSDAQTVNTDKDVNFKIILKPIGNESIKNVLVKVKLDPGLDFKSPANLKVTDGYIAWPEIPSLETKWQENFTATVNDKNINADLIPVIATATAKSSDSQSITNESVLELEFMLLGSWQETEGSIILYPPETGAPARERLVRPFRSIGETLIWDRAAWMGWKQPRPKEIEYFIVEKGEIPHAKKISVIGSIGNNS